MSVLLSHRESRSVTLSELSALPAPKLMGPMHRPVPHHELVEALKEELSIVGLEVNREEYAIQRYGLKLFGVMDLIPRVDTPSPLSNGDRGLGLGFRHGNDQSLSLNLIAGTRVFVCDNLTLSGDMIVLRRKHTKGLSLRDEVRAGIERLLLEYPVLEQGIERLKERQIGHIEAKAMIYDAFVHHDVLPIRYLEPVGNWFFYPPAEAEDCHPRTLWGLHNAFTRTVKELSSPARRFEATTRLGQVFGLKGYG